MEYENKHAASRGLAGTALGLGAGAVGVELLNALGGGNGLAGLFGGNKSNCNVGELAAMMAMLSNTNCGGSSNSFINRYEAEQAARIAELETEVKLRDANTFTMGEMGKLRDYVDSKFARVEHELCDQKVYNATLNGTISCIGGQIAQLMSLTKLVVPNTAVCPGWGDVNVTIAPATTTTAGA